MSRRVINWPRVLAEFLTARESAPFAWGENDCCLFACDGIRALTGLDPAAKVFRGRYRDAAGATRLLRKHGGVEAITERLCAEHGFAELRDVRLAQRGDVLIHDNDGRAVLALCDGRHAISPGATGSVRVPVSVCRRAWRID